jgi:hypothetical protein
MTGRQRATPGRVLVDRYELVSMIGQGPHGAVWKARELGTRLNLAVKLLDTSVTLRPEVLDRFHREHKVLTAFLAPAVVRVRELVPVDDTIALVTELVEGEDLRRRLDRSGPLARADAVAAAVVLAHALGAAHAAGVVHCDIKPRNILLAEPGGDIRLSDFRVARLARGPLDGTGTPTYAKPEYAAPEVASGGTPVPPSDVYALGAVIREMVGGTVNDPRLSRLLDDCLLPAADRRPTAHQVADRLRDLAPMPVRRENATLAGAPDNRDARPLHQMTKELVPIADARPPAQTRARSRRGVFPVVAVAVVVVLAVGSPLVLSRASESGRPVVAASATPQARTSKATGAVSADPSASSGTGSPLALVDEPAVVASATTFAHDWFGALNLAVSTGDTSPLAAASSPACLACQEAAAIVAATYSDGGALRGGTYVVRDIDVDNFFTTDLASLHVVFDRAPRSAVNPTGEVVEVLPGAAFLTGHVILERVNGGWRTREIQAANRII